jgi:predicted MFS family arabinose efflux permease
VLFLSIAITLHRLHYIVVLEPFYYLPYIYYFLINYNFSGLLGSLFGGLGYDRFNKIGVFVTIVSSMGVVTAVTPWCTYLPAMLVVHALHGVFNGALDTGCTFNHTYNS